MVHEKTAEGLILFRGVNFRSEDLSCPACRWTGLAGQLKVPNSGRLTNNIVYACPRCGEVLATHAGLTDDEVMNEMTRIRGMLASEMSSTRLRPGPDYSETVTNLDFESIRAAIRVEEAQSEDVAEEGGSDAAAAEEAGQPENNAAADKKEADSELDFAAIRARLTEVS